MADKQKQIFIVEGSLAAKFDFIEISESADDILQKSLTGSDIKKITLTLDTGKEVVLECSYINYVIDRVDEFEE